MSAINKRDRPVSNRFSNDVDRRSSDLHQLVERWNHWSHASMASDCENYINGDVQFLFEFEHPAGQDLPEGRAIHISACPRDIDLSSTHAKIMHVGREVRHHSPNVRARQCFVVCRWDGKPVLVEAIEAVEKIEKFVPSIFRMGLQVDKSPKKAGRDPIGQSVLHAFLKPCSGFTKRELDSPLVLFAGSERRDDRPVSLIEGSPQVLNDICDNGDGVIYDGFISFGAQGTLTGLCVRLDDITKWALFLEKLVKLIDVFRGPISFSQSVIRHVRHQDKRGRQRRRHPETDALDAA